MIVLLTQLIYANNGYVDEDFDPYEADAVKTANSVTINANIDKIAEAGNLHEVPVEKLSEENVHKYINDLSPTQKKGLSAKQLVYTNEQTGKTTIDLVLANELNSDARNEALEILGRTKGKVESNTNNQETSITTLDDGWFIDKIFYLSIDNVHVIEGEGISYRDNVLSVDKAKTIQVKDGELFAVTNFSGNAIEFDVGDVKEVKNRCVDMHDVTNSHFKINDKNIEVSSKEGVKFEIKDCSGSETEFEAFSNESKITISKDKPAKYNISEGALKCSYGNVTDSIAANNSASLDIGSFCFNCINIEPIGTYWYSDDKIIKDFGINIPKNGQNYKLCLRKIDGQPFDNYNGLVDFPNKEINLNGIVNYLRYPFEDGILTELLMKEVYEGKDIGNNVAMSLDDDFIFIDNFFIENQNITNIGLISFIYNGKYSIYGYFNGKEIKRYGRFNEELMPNVIKKYNSDFGNQNPEVFFIDNIMVQEGLNGYGTVTSVKAVCRDCWQKEDFKQKMLQRKEHYLIKVDMNG